MCLDASFTSNIEKIHQDFPNLLEEEVITVDPSKSIHILGHNFEKHPIVFQKTVDQPLQLKLMEWGCIPYYIQEEPPFLKYRNTMLNARSERVLADPSSYWYKIKSKRCLMPVSGIFEHRAITGWKHKIPYYIYQPSTPLFYLPALYSVATLPDQQTGEMTQRYTFAMLTRKANSLMAKIHNGGSNAGRMPLFLPLSLAKEWVSNLNMDRLTSLLEYEFPSDQLAAHPVFTIRSKKTHPLQQLKTAPFHWPNLPELVDH